MTDRRRARADQVARRVNTARQLLDGGMNVVDATRAIARRHRLSERQARRYVERARDQGAMAVPGPKIVFTVKLAPVLARGVRQLARSTGRSISTVVSEALTEFLDRHHRGGSG